MGGMNALLPTKKVALTSGAISVGRKHGLLLDRNLYPLNAVPQASEHQQEAIFPQAEHNFRRALVRTFNTQEAADQESGHREMGKRLHEAKMSRTRSSPAVNEIQPGPKVEGKAREGTVDRLSYFHILTPPSLPSSYRHGAVRPSGNSLHCLGERQEPFSWRE